MSHNSSAAILEQFSKNIFSFFPTQKGAELSSVNKTLYICSWDNLVWDNIIQKHETPEQMEAAGMKLVNEVFYLLLSQLKYGETGALLTAIWEKLKNLPVKNLPFAIRPYVEIFKRIIPRVLDVPSLDPKADQSCLDRLQNIQRYRLYALLGAELVGNTYEQVIVRLKNWINDASMNSLGKIKRRWLVLCLNDSDIEAMEGILKRTDTWQAIDSEYMKMLYIVGVYRQELPGCYIELLKKLIHSSPALSDKDYNMLHFRMKIPDNLLGNLLPVIREALNDRITLRRRYNACCVLTQLPVYFSRICFQDVMGYLDDDNRQFVNCIYKLVNQILIQVPSDRYQVEKYLNAFLSNLCRTIWGEDSIKALSAVLENISDGAWAAIFERDSVINIFQFLNPNEPYTLDKQIRGITFLTKIAHHLPQDVLSICLDSIFRILSEANEESEYKYLFAIAFLAGKMMKQLDADFLSDYRNIIQTRLASDENFHICKVFYCVLLGFSPELAQSYLTDFFQKYAFICQSVFQEIYQMKTLEREVKSQIIFVLYTLNGRLQLSFQQELDSEMRGYIDQRLFWSNTMTLSNIIEHGLTHETVLIRREACRKLIKVPREAASYLGNVIERLNDEDEQVQMLVYTVLDAVMREDDVCLTAEQIFSILEHFNKKVINSNNQNLLMEAEAVVANLFDQQPRDNVHESLRVTVLP